MMISGLHHVTAIARDPQRNVDFYAGVLGLRLVKRTVNFDDPSAYHLYYGDGAGRPGTIVTFFTWPGSAPAGRSGTGQMAAIAFSAAASSLAFWTTRLAQHGVPVERVTRFGDEVLTFVDPDGVALEIVGVAADDRPGWSAAGIPPEHALRGLFTAPLSLRDSAPTAALLTEQMGFKRIAQEGARTRYGVGAQGPGALVDLVEVPTGSRGRDGAGAIHHLAWRVAGDAEQGTLRAELLGHGLTVSPVRDRTYFRSIYYREPGGILFEIATDVPGFGVDETAESLGTALKLPVQFEAFRAQIEQALPPLRAARVAA